MLGVVVSNSCGATFKGHSYKQDIKLYELDLGVNFTGTFFIIELLKKKNHHTIN